MTPEEFDACFDRPFTIARKLETRRRYVAPGEAERIAAFEDHEPRPVRSVRTSPWLARVAVTTATAGKSWQRIRILDSPLTPYQLYGMPGLLESQAAGEEVHVVDRTAVPGLRHDFWWFPPTSALLMAYDEGDRYLGAREITAAGSLAQLEAEWDRAMSYAIPLNSYLAAHRDVLRAA